MTPIERAALMSPLERAARALHAEMGLDWPHTYSDEEMVPLARAVIAAIREPSEAMTSDRFTRAQGYAGDIYLVWQAMIDALLAEGK